MPSTKRTGRPGWWRSYLDQLPGVAGSLTTAALLFAAAVILQPTIQRLFSTPARSYPISCSADPVALDGEHERATAAFFIVNRANEALTAEQLRTSLSNALNRDVDSQGTAIRIHFGPYDGRFLTAEPDRVFNGDKGELHVMARDAETTIVIDRIEANAILKVDIVWTQSPPPPPENFTRDTKGALPFGRREYEQACYSG